MATIKQVSELAGVSLATVSRVINNTGQVKPHTKERVEKAMKDLDYRPNYIAQSLASNKSNTIGYVVPELHGAFFGAMISPAEKILRNASKHVIISAGHSREEDEMSAIESLRDRRCDALILHLEAVSDDYLVKLAKEKVMFIVVNRYIPEIAEHCISIDNIKGAEIATSALTDLGHKYIAYISGPKEKDDAVDRLEGHKNALEKAGIPFDTSLIFPGNFQAHSGYEQTLKILSDKPEVTAIVCANDEMAYGALGAIREKGLSIPEDVSVIGFDDVEFSQFTYPRLTTMHYAKHTLGEQAARWVLANVYNQEINYNTDRIVPHLVTRDSISEPHA
ncbi:LacI family DNA-binding transcriptional regulator [Alteromonas sp. a30]|uniref:LacI family DNA-binding transcriptional regulator n=1 Tax=Alteromonas sp. a30 TaxID=2730917 RepID=UPI00227F57B9|nr:LacI family DNA-binding transcriptional regulator [Alteromonas sp. a30]MCY7294036.1 LacI family DNA-binding transcriptional regulator [Alteromonas sp. a30]